MKEDKHDNIFALFHQAKFLTSLCRTSWLSGNPILIILNEVGLRANIFTLFYPVKIKGGQTGNFLWKPGKNSYQIHRLHNPGAMRVFKATESMCAIRICNFSGLDGEFHQRLDCWIPVRVNQKRGNSLARYSAPF